MLYPFFLAAVTTVFVISYFLIYPIFVYFRDPKRLRKYTGINVIAPLTNLGFCYEVARPSNGFRSKKLNKLHKTHKVIRTGPNSLSFAGGDAIRDIYGHGSKCTKDQFYEVLAGTHYHLADVVDKPEHARKRKVLSAAYALKNLESWEFKVADKTERFIRGCDAHCIQDPEIAYQNSPDSTFDYRAWTNFFTLDAIADIGLSERLGLLDQGHDLVTAERMDGSLYKVNFRNCLHSTARAQCELVWAYDWYHFNEKLSRWISPRYRQLWKANSGWNDIVYHRATQRLKRYQKGEKLDDFFQGEFSFLPIPTTKQLTIFAALMEDKNGYPNALEWGEIVAEVSIMNNAGSDTTAISMNNIMHHLLKNPSKLEKLRSELSNVLPMPTDTSCASAVVPYDIVKHLPYLKACLDESLRLTPPTTFGLPRKTPAEGTTIAGEFVPGNTSVSISAYVAHRDEHIFPRAEEFIPERWLSGDANPFGKDPRDLQAYFIAFSAGARGCIGKNISYLEQSVLLASVVMRYDFALPENWVQERFETMNLMPGPMPLRVWRRQWSEVA